MNRNWIAAFAVVIVLAFVVRSCESCSVDKDPKAFDAKASGDSKDKLVIDRTIKSDIEKWEVPPGPKPSYVSPNGYKIVEVGDGKYHIHYKRSGNRCYYREFDTIEEAQEQIYVYAQSALDNYYRTRGEDYMPDPDL